MTEQVEVGVTHIDVRKYPHLRNSIQPNYVAAVYGDAGERIARMAGQAGDAHGECPSARVVADSLATSWPSMQVCVWLDLSVWPAARLADNVVPPDAIGST